MALLGTNGRAVSRLVPLLLAGILAGGVLIQPAVAHVTRRLNHLFRHLDPRYINVGEAAGGSLTGTYPNPGIANNAIGAGQLADNSVTSAKIADNAVGSSEIADNAVGSGEVADNSLTGADINEASLGTVPNADALDGLDSSQFVQNGGIKIAVLKTWHAWPGAVSIDSNFFGFTTFSAAGALANQRLLLIPDIPVTLYGKSLQLTGMEVCYNATDANVVLDEVHLTRDRANNASSTSGAFVVNDTTDRDDNTCRTYTGTPEVLAPNAFATVDLVVDWLAAGSFTVTRTTLFLQPTGSEAPPLPVQGDVHHDISEA